LFLPAVEVFMSDSLIDAKEVAERLRVQLPTVYAAANDGRIPCVRLWQGKRRTLIRFRPEDIDRFIAERTTSVKGE